MIRHLLYAVIPLALSKVEGSLPKGAMQLRQIVDQVKLARKRYNVQEE